MLLSPRRRSRRPRDDVSRGDGDVPEWPSAPCRADRRMGADRAPVRLARAEGLRAHPPAGAVWWPGLRARGGDGRGLRAHAAAQGGALRGGGDGEAFRLRASQAQEATGFHEALDRRPEGRVSGLQRQRDRQRLLRPLRPQSGAQDRQARARRGAHAPEVRALLAALPREGRARRAQARRGRPARRRLERQGIAGYLRVHTPSSTRFAHNDEPITLAGRVHLFFGYVDLHRRSHLADLGERADGREVVPMRPVKTLLIVVALVYGVITRVRSVQALKELDLQPCGDDSLRQKKLQWRGVPTGYLRAHGLELVLHHLFG